MIKKLFKIVLSICLLGVLILLSMILIPRNYNVLEFQERPNTEYWELSTGSKIGYQKIEGDSNSNNNPIIYLHGGPGGIVTDETIDMLTPLSQNNFDIYLYDQVGSGHSNRLSDINEYTVERHKADLEEIIEKVGSKQVILLGQSWGAILAMQYLADNPNKVEKIIFSGPGPILPINHELSKVESPDSLHLKNPKYSNREGNLKANNIRSRFISYCANVFGKKMSTDKEADDFFTHLNNELNKSTNCTPIEIKESSGGRGYYVHLMTLKSFSKLKNRKDKVDGLETPTLIIKGQCDNQKWGFTKEYLDLLPNTKLEIIEGAGHIIDKEHHKEYIAIINDFLK